MNEKKKERKKESEVKELIIKAEKAEWKKNQVRKDGRKEQAQAEMK